ncbi:MAG: hypothetical protein HYT70_03660 [Candidatus Aenigmarchaeota archaeon]|nr:hypothetical protein [Candidatus Aenigmarchaeota archaeon]
MSIFRATRVGGAGESMNPRCDQCGSKTKEIEKGANFIMYECTNENCKEILQQERTKSKRVKEEEPKGIETTFIEDKDTLVQQVYSNSPKFVIYKNGSYSYADEYTSGDGLLYIPLNLVGLMLRGRPIVNFASYPISYESFEMLSNKINSFIDKYFDIGPSDRKLCTYFIIFTWLYDKVSVTPYLRFIADFGSGKTRGLFTIGHLCYNSFMAAGSSTVSGAMRLQNRIHGTPLFNESDFRNSDDTVAFIKWTNNGFESGLPVIMSNKENPSTQDVFDPFGPKLFVMKRPFVDTAAESRLISIAPKETRRKDIPVLLPDEFYAEALEIRNMLLDYRMKNWHSIDQKQSLNIDELNIEARLKQICYPLSYIIPENAIDDFKKYMELRQQEIKKQRADSWQGVIFNTLLSIIEDDEERKLKYVTSKMIAEELKSSPQKITSTLKEIGLRVTISRFSDKTARHIVVDSLEAWERVCSRYFVDINSSMPACPDIIKSPEFVTGVTGVTPVTIDGFVTPVTDVTDVTRTACHDCSSTSNLTSLADTYDPKATLYLCKSCIQNKEGGLA